LSSQLRRSQFAKPKIQAPTAQARWRRASALTPNQYQWAGKSRSLPSSPWEVDSPWHFRCAHGGLRISSIASTVFLRGRQRRCVSGQTNQADAWPPSSSAIASVRQFGRHLREVCGHQKSDVNSMRAKKRRFSLARRSLSEGGNRRLVGGTSSVCSVSSLNLWDVTSLRQGSSSAGRGRPSQAALLDFKNRKFLGTQLRSRALPEYCDSNDRATLRDAGCVAGFRRY
jgi:hypothetical protein